MEEEVRMKKTRKPIKWNHVLQAILSGVLTILTACVPIVQAPNMTGDTPVNPTLTPSAPMRREAQIQSVETQLTNTSPVQVNAIVRGNLTESCAVLGETQVEYTPNTFQITVYTLSPTDHGCVQTTMPFETTILLNSKDLPAGTYTIVANGVSAVFTLPVDDPTPSPEPSATLASVSQTCVNSAAFVGDITIPDNTIVASNTAFTKIWSLKNTGTCTWDSSYLVAYISGTTMSQQPGYWIVPQGQTVTPGQTVDVSVGMTSPVKNGNYQSYWGLKKEQGQFMPIQGGANGNSFFVKIKVNDGIGDGGITAASVDIDREEGSGTVCTADATYFVHAYITAEGPTTVSYEVNSTAGQIAAGYFQTSPTGPVSPVVTGTLVFDKAETKSMDWRFVGPYPYPDDITVNLWVNGEKWHNTKLACQ